MVNKLSKLAYNFLLQAASSALIKILTLLLIPVSIRFLKPEDFGLFSLFNSFIAILSLIIAGGLRQVFWVDFFKQPIAERRHQVNDSIIIYLFATVPLLAILYKFSPAINNILFMAQATSGMIIVTLLSCFLIFFVELIYQFCIHQQRIAQSLFCQLLNASVMMMSSLFLLWYGYAVFGLLLAQLLGNAAVCCYGFYLYVQKNMRASLSVRRASTIARRYLYEGYTATPALVCMWLLGSVSRLTIAYYSLATAGEYAMVEMIATIFQLLIIRPLQATYLPVLVEQFSAPAANVQQVDQHNKKIMWLVMVCLMVVSVVSYMMFRPLVYWLLPASYHAAVPLSLYMGAAQIIAVGTVFALGYIQFRKKSLWVTVALVVSSVLNFALTALLLPRYGLVGALGGLIVSSGAYFVGVLWYNQILHRKAGQKISSNLP